MVFDSRLEQLCECFGIQKPDDWCNVRVADIRKIHGVGDGLINHLRLHLASRGLTLLNDGAPEKWQELLSRSSVNTKADFKPKVTPFQIIIDVQEKQPFTFSGIQSDSTDGKRVPVHVLTETKALGPSHGDYSLVGFEDEVSIERKSLHDALSTFLSHGERRERFEKTLEHLANTPYAAVVIECSIGTLIANVKSRGARSEDVLGRTLHRQILAWAEDYRVPFHFFDDRRLAEVSTFHILRRAWKKLVEIRTEDREESTVDRIHNFL